MPRLRSKSKVRKSRSKSKSRKQSKAPLRKYQKTLMSFQQCDAMTVKQIRKSAAFKKLVPFGTYKNSSNKYHYGKRSYMKKSQICEALSNPKAYHKKIKKNFVAKKNSGPRKRNSRLGDCRPYSRKPPCKRTGAFKHSGLTTTAKKCCYKRAMSTKTKNKRRKNAAKKTRKRTTYNRTKSNQGKSKKKRSRKRS